MVNWQALEGVGGVATAVAVIIALVFGLVQVRQAAAQRQEAAAAGIIGQMMTPAFIAALDVVMELTDGTPQERIRDDARLRQAVMEVDVIFEVAGILVHGRSIGLHYMDAAIGGVARAGWRKVEPFIVAERERRGDANLGEWWQWMVERMEADPVPGKHLGAHVAHRDWRP